MGTDHAYTDHAYMERPYTGHTYTEAYGKAALFCMLIVLLLTGCMSVQRSADPAQTGVKTGLEVLRDTGFAALKGKCVGLVTNPTGVDRELKSTIDILAEAEGVELVALFSPEHGIRGNITAGARVDDYIDERTGLTVYSLYGSRTKPTADMLSGIDILVYDIQDIGTRSYTFISTMGKVMEGAAEQNVEVLILDRPNPIGGLRVEGPLVREGYFSFVSQYPIPYVHGLTSGELAAYINEQLLEKPCVLSVMPMEGWRRDMSFADTGLPWVPSSPHIPHAEMAAFYPATGIMGELGTVNIGVGYTLPFELMGTEWITEPERLAERLNALSLPGLRFRPAYWKPYYGAQAGKNIGGVQIFITDPLRAPLTLIQFYFLQEAHALYPDQDVFAAASEANLSMFDKVCGSDQIRSVFTRSFSVDELRPLWDADAENFRLETEPFLLY